jgi:hypothetical protein
MTAKYDFTDLLSLLLILLRNELVSTVTDLVNVLDLVAYLRAEETSLTKPDRIKAEAERDVLIEKKWLIIKLMDTYVE